MDIFSILPIILFFYGLFTIFGSGSKNKNQRPNQNTPRPNQQNRNPQPSRQEQFAPKTWKERFEELERELFPKEGEVPKKVSIPKPEPISEGYRVGDYSSEGFQGVEGIGAEGYQGVEGIPGVEGSAGVEGGFRDREKLVVRPASSRQTKTPARQKAFPRVTESSLQQGVIWAEVLGKPRALRKWSYERK